MVSNSTKHLLKVAKYIVAQQQQTPAEFLAQQVTSKLPIPAPLKPVADWAGQQIADQVQPTQRQAVKSQRSREDVLSL